MSRAKSAVRGRGNAHWKTSFGIYRSQSLILPAKVAECQMTSEYFSCILESWLIGYKRTAFIEEKYRYMKTDKKQEPPLWPKVVSFSFYTIKQHSKNRWLIFNLLHFLKSSFVEVFVFVLLLFCVRYNHLFTCICSLY